jgi:hypothetical protein
MERREMEIEARRLGLRFIGVKNKDLAEAVESAKAKELADKALADLDDEDEDDEPEAGLRAPKGKGVATGKGVPKGK